MKSYYLVDCVDVNTKEKKHEVFIGRDVVILEAEAGKPAWLCIKSDDEWCPWHRVRTSIVKDVYFYEYEYRKANTEEIKIETRNTIYYIESK